MRVRNGLIRITPPGWHLFFMTNNANETAKAVFHDGEKAGGGRAPSMDKFCVFIIEHQGQYCALVNLFCLNGTLDN